MATIRRSGKSWQALIREKDYLGQKTKTFSSKAQGQKPLLFKGKEGSWCKLPLFTFYKELLIEDQFFSASIQPLLQKTKLQINPLKLQAKNFYSD